MIAGHRRLCQAWCWLKRGMLQLSRLGVPLAAGVFCATGNADQVVRFAPLPMQRSEHVLKQYQPMLDYISSRTGIRFELVYTVDYDELLREFGAGRVDMAYLGPLPYVALTERYEGIVPLVSFRNAEGRDRYTCSLFRRGGEEPARDSSGVAGLTQPLSTCGYLSSEMLLQSTGDSLTRRRYRFAGTHTDVILGVLLGDFELGGAKTAIVRRYAHLGLRTIAETHPWPGFLLAINRETVPRDTRERIAKSLLDLEPLSRQEDAEITASWGNNLKYGVTPSSDCDFDEVRLHYGQMKIPGLGDD